MATLRSRVKYSKLKVEADDELEAKVEDSEEAAKVAGKEVNSKKDKPKKKPGRWAVPLPRDKGYDDEQFEDVVPIKAPIKSIIIAIVLFVLGTIMLTLGSLMLAGVINQGQGSFRASPLMVIGAIIFIPGAYNVRTAYLAWRGYPGYSFADIAGFGEDQ